MLFYLFLFSIISVEYNTPGEYKFTLTAGEHYIECYGAQGGQGMIDNAVKSQGGKGAFVSGYINITGEAKTFYAFVGGKGSTGKVGPNAGGQNGGGYSGEDTGIISKDDGSGGGGGASDIRYKTNFYYDRVMVAAGGSGGAGECNGAPGGDLNGYYAASKNNFLPDKRVNQNNGNIEGKGEDGLWSDYVPGSGAGGGWRGGATSGTGTTSITDKNFHKAVAASGSSYISGEYGCSLHPEVSFYKRQMVSGDHEGDGLIKINTIFNCSNNCYSCSSKDVCTKCNGNYIMYNNGCVLSCPDGYIEINGKCEPCKSPCGQCIESTTKCTTCKTGFLYDNKCQNYCPDGFVGIENECKKCDESCKLCETTTTNCFDCADGYILYDNKCITSCPDGTVKSGNTCENCQPSCKTCYETSEKCTSCNVNLFLHDGNCVTSCPNGLFGKNGQCVECISPCETCDEVDKCTTCKESFYLYNGQCLVDCPPGTNKIDSKCI